MKDCNQQLYENRDVVDYYSSSNRLQKPEEIILNQFKERFQKMRFLDIGIGGGRTTPYFASLVKEYIGIDYSESMINACRNRFRDYPKAVHFKVVDVRNMSVLEDHYFDFILISFNGLDYITHDERLSSLREIKRVGKEGGYFCFSSHNLSFDFKGYYGLIFFPSLRKTFRQFKRSLMFFMKNKNHKAFKNKDYALICDDLFFFKFKTYYIKPQAQIDQLKDLGFNNIRIFSITDGKEIEHSEANELKDNWCYYLCNL